MKTPETPKPEAPKDVKEEPVLKPKPPLGEDKPEKQEVKTITIPGPRTDSGKPETREIAPESPTSLHSALTAVSEQAAPPVYTSVDFGDAGKLKIEAVTNMHNGLSGSEHDVVLRVNDEKTFTLTNVPASYLTE